VRSAKSRFCGILMLQRYLHRKSLKKCSRDSEILEVGGEIEHIRQSLLEMCGSFRQACAVASNDVALNDALQLYHSLKRQRCALISHKRTTLLGTIRTKFFRNLGNKCLREQDAGITACKVAPRNFPFVERDHLRR
jgi:hypothetical protein